MLESLGLIERRADYSAGGVAGYSQRFRLTEPYRAEETVEVDLVLRERVTSLPARRKKAGPAVHPWLVESYARLGLDTTACLAELTRLGGFTCAPDFEGVRAAIESMEGAAVVFTKAGEVAKKQPADPRDQWRSKVDALAKWRTAGLHLEHTLYRDASVGRLFSAVTDLPSWARSRLTIDGEPVVSLDIRACGLTIQAAMMRRAGADTDADVRVVCDLIEGPTRDPYASLAALLLGGPQGDEDREGFKGRVLKDLWFSSIGAQLRSPIGVAVSERLPGFHEYLLRAKRTTGHGELASQTMRVESSLVIDLLPPVLAAEGIALATVHDCVIVKACEAARAKVLFEGLLHSHGVRAVVM
jgi:hypothetical protein